MGPHSFWGHPAWPFQWLLIAVGLAVVDEYRHCWSVHSPHLCHLQLERPVLQVLGSNSRTELLCFVFLGWASVLLEIVRQPRTTYRRCRERVHHLLQRSARSVWSVFLRTSMHAASDYVQWNLLYVLNSKAYSSDEVRWTSVVAVNELQNNSAFVNYH